jgi:hypothetical protein
MRRWVLSSVAVIVALAGCGDSSGETTVEALLPATTQPFVAGADNPYFPLLVGATWAYEGVAGDEVERIEVVVTGETRTVDGVESVVVRDTVSVDGEVVEDTFDWYARDEAGNVWYVGEETEEFEDGEVVSTSGSWEAGVDGAEPGVIMWADPEARIGEAYYQEYYEGEAEDQARVVRVEPSVTVAAGTFEDVIVIEEWNPFDEGVVEEKYYAPGVGVILEEKVAGGSERVELLEYSIP